MPKEKIAFNCSECGAQSPKWSGQCSDCGAWNSLIEVTVQASSRIARFTSYAGTNQDVSVQALSEVTSGEVTRVAIGLAEVDRVLGGGLVAGSVILIGGDPGIGKSTLLLQSVASLSPRVSTLYITGEESPEQVALRGRRLGLACGDVRILAETSVERILAAASREHPQVMVIDSIQTVYTELLQSAPGSVAQVRESAAQLVRFAKQTGTVLFLVGHVTKEGTLAGPRVLEHMVDTVLYFEGDQDGRYRVVRSVKNRFGAVNELGVFAMTDKGLREVSNPSAIFLSRHKEPVSGSVIMVTREGTRPMLVEVQALVDQSHMANPRRVTLGLKHNRLSMLLAVLHRHGGIAAADQDVFVNIVGGIKVTETAVDLAVLMAILSSFRDRVFDDGLVVFGEVGLAGEIRPVPNGQDRLQEAAKHGFKRAIIPAANAPKKPINGLAITPIQRLSEVIDIL